MSYHAKSTDLYNMINTGQLMEAFEKYYAEDVVLIEATGDKREGKDANREYEKKFLGMLKEVHGAGVTGLTADEQNATTMVESWMDVTFQDGNRVKLEQVAVQRWKGDQIVNERFYYNAP